MTWYHPNYYKKLKQNSSRCLSSSTKDTTSEVSHNPPTMEVSVGQVSGISPTRTSQKETDEK